MKQINFICDILGMTGYSSHSRQLFNAVAKAYDNTRLDMINKPQGWQVNVTDKEKECIERKKDKAEDRIDIFIGLPHQAQPFKNNSKHFWQFVVWEGTHIPKFWQGHLLSNVEKILVPSIHVRQAIENTIDLMDNCYIIPHGVDSNLFPAKPADKKNEKFTFVANKGWTDAENDRGGIQYIVRAYLNTFKKSDSVRLLLKINKSYNPNFDVRAALNNIAKDIPTETRPEIMVSESMVPYENLAKEIYWEGDVFVTATQGEAFNLPCIEAMSCGLPVIATNFGGQTDFINSENGWLVGYDLIKPKEIAYEETYWGQIKLSELSLAMLDAFNSKELNKKSEKAIEKSKEFTWEESAKKIINLLC